MALNTVTRVQDPRSASIDQITPKNWHKYPPRVASMTPAFVRTVTFTGGHVGDEVFEATANATTDYSPKTQADKVWQSTPPRAIAVDITTPRGWIDPAEPYNANPPAPTITSLSPNTAVHGASDFTMTVNGTGFTPYTAIIWNNASAEVTNYISATQVSTLVKGTLVGQAIAIPVQVWDKQLSNVSTFTFT